VFFKIAQYGPGVEVFTRYQIDVLEAVVDAPGLPEKFYSERLPRARAAVERARAKNFAVMARAKGMGRPSPILTR
jgi:protein-disulfide isomerase-like protein with CxxC motif